MSGAAFGGMHRVAGGEPWVWLATKDIGVWKLLQGKGAVGGKKP